MVHFIMTKVEVSEMGAYNFSFRLVASLTQKLYWRQIQWQYSVIMLGHGSDSQVLFSSLFLGRDRVREWIYHSRYHQ